MQTLWSPGSPFHFNEMMTISGSQADTWHVFEGFTQHNHLSSYRISNVWCSPSLCSIIMSNIDCEFNIPSFDRARAKTLISIDEWRFLSKSRSSLYRMCPTVGGTKASHFWLYAEYLNQLIRWDQTFFCHFSEYWLWLDTCIFLYS